MYTNFKFPTQSFNEGNVKLIIPKLELFSKGKSEYIPSKAPVFYNPKMKENRDIAVYILKTYQKKKGKKINICDPFTGCGVRGIRIVVELENIKRVILNDIDPKASDLARLNASLNINSKKVIIKNSDANALLNKYASKERRFDFIDIDPFGSPSPYLDSAIRAIKNNGLIALTATDMAPLCGVNKKACFRKYFSIPLRTEYCHELAIRIILNHLSLSAAKYGFGINPILGYTKDHYARVYVILSRGTKITNESLDKIGFISHCFNCLNRKYFLGLRFILEKCEYCGKNMQIAGPIWLGKIVDYNFCLNVLENIKEYGNEKILKFFKIFLDEAIAPIGYYVIDRICQKSSIPSISTDRILDQLINNGYVATKTNFNYRGIKTNAPIDIIYKYIKKLN